MSKDFLKPKEQLFCIYYSQCRNRKEAAVKSGYKLTPELSAMKLLEKDAVKKEILKLSKQVDSTNDIKAGLRRLAFGSVADSVKLIFSSSEQELQNIDQLDLFNISEIKFTKSGGTEIKFFDRLKAFEKLSQITQLDNENNSLPFYKALEKSAVGVSKLLGEESDYGV